MSDNKTLSATATKVSNLLVEDLGNKDTVFEKTLPEHLTPAIVEDVAQHHVDVAAGTVNAVTILGIKAAQASGDTKAQTTIRVKTGKGSHIDATFTPKKEGTLPARNGGEPTQYTSFGSVTVGVKTSMDSKGGQMGVALDLAKSLTEEALGGK